MKFRRRPPAEVGIDLTPLIDVVFLLLIFFMVSTTFIRESRLEVELPEAAVDAQPELDSPLEVVITANGTFAVDGRTLVDRRRGTLLAALQAMLDERGIDSSAATGGRPPLVIVADGRAQHRDVVMAMDLAGELGFTRLRIATRQSEGDPADASAAPGTTGANP